MELIDLIIYSAVLIAGVKGQGRLMDPPGRGSMWRVGFDTPVNPDDNVLNCGGMQRRWELNNGKCGVCGDPWDSKPRQHELDGVYATGTITNTYSRGGHIDIHADVAATKGGFFEVQICDNASRATEECFLNNVLTLVELNATRYYDVVSGENTARFSLPDNLVCEHCVLRWKYRTADHYGCEKDTLADRDICGFGRGPFYNEYFSCSDIAIVSSTTFVSTSRQMDQSLARSKLHLATGNQYDHPRVRRKRTVHVHFPSRSSSTSRNTPPYVRLPENPTVSQLPFTRLSRRPTSETHWIRWSWRDTRSQGRERRRVMQQQQQLLKTQPEVRFQEAKPLRVPSRNFPPNVDISQLEVGRGEMFPGSVPVPSMVRVQQPVVRQIVRSSQTTGGARTATSPLFQQIDSTQIQNTFLDPFNTNFGSKVTVNKHIFSKHTVKTKQCNACPFDQCLDKTLELDNIFPGLFEKPAEFLECRRYTKLFSVGKYKLLSEGLPSCSHPRFRRQLRTVTRIDEDDFGCCGTRPQVVLPLTVESDSSSYNVVQLPNERSQFLVQGICGHNNTTSCSACVAENNFQWVLVYDPRVNTSPPVSFVPVKFPHYCRCLNPGRTLHVG